MHQASNNLALCAICSAVHGIVYTWRQDRLAELWGRERGGGDRWGSGRTLVAREGCQRARGNFRRQLLCRRSWRGTCKVRRAEAPVLEGLLVSDRSSKTALCLDLLEALAVGW